MIKKDLRALLPLWAACIATMIGGRLAGGEYLDFSIVGYLLGSAAIGAWSIGHEYAHRTLGTLLTLPVPRWRIWLWKLEVTAPLLLSLNMIALAIFPRSPHLRLGAATYYLPTLAGPLHRALADHGRPRRRRRRGLHEQHRRHPVCRGRLAWRAALRLHARSRRLPGQFPVVDAHRPVGLCRRAWMAPVLAPAGAGCFQHRCAPTSPSCSHGRPRAHRCSPSPWCADPEGTPPASTRVARRRHVCPAVRGRRRDTPVAA